MEIILLQDVEKLGDKHEIVSVKPGYARNYLIPHKYAIIANSTNRKKLADIIKEEEAKELARKTEYEDIANLLEGKIIKIGAKAGTTGKIFGSVTNIQLSNALKEQFDVEIDRKKIQLLDEVKELGSYKAQLNLHPEVISEVDFEVVQE